MDQHYELVGSHTLSITVISCFAKATRLCGLPIAGQPCTKASVLEALAAKDYKKKRERKKKKKTTYIRYFLT